MEFGFLLNFIHNLTLFFHSTLRVARWLAPNGLKSTCDSFIQYLSIATLVFDMCYSLELTALFLQYLLCFNGEPLKIIEYLIFLEVVSLHDVL